MATLVFSIILLLATLGILQVNRVYYRGVTEANTQNVARSIMDTISQGIQFSGGSVTPIPTTASPTPGGTYYVCVNDQQFIYWPGYQLISGSGGLGTHQAHQALIQRTVSGCPIPSGIIVGRELLSPNMRVSNLQVSRVGASSLYRVEIRIVYGDEDVLSNPTSTTSTCNGVQAGNQFCSVSDLTTVVEKRIN